MHILQFIHSAVMAHLNFYSQFSANMNRATTNVFVQTHFCSCSVRYVAIFSALVETVKYFSKTSVPIYTPTSSMQEFQLLHQPW